MRSQIFGMRNLQQCYLWC